MTKFPKDADRLDRLRRLFQDGDFCRAHDLSTSLIGSKPYDEELYLIAARSAWEMKQPIRAGLYFMLTNDCSDEGERAIQAASARHGKLLNQRLRLYVHPTFLPSEIHKRLISVLNAAGSGAPIARIREQPASFGSIFTPIVGCGIVIVCIVLMIAGVLYFIDLFTS